MATFKLPENAATYAALLQAYGEEHRHYHNADHIDACLDQLDDVSAEADKPEEIELALWFHDAIYDPFSASNERDSADWALDFMRSNELADDVMSRIEALIMVTHGHAATSSGDERLMIDIDLSILGQRPELYDRFEAAIRKEYGHVPTALFSQKRKEILTDFLNRDHLYNTAYFAQKLEDQARINLANAIAVLN